ncbi:hypothetical protein T05_13575, partial [Trichinella murrelli]
MLCQNMIIVNYPGQQPRSINWSFICCQNFHSHC